VTYAQRIGDLVLALLLAGCACLWAGVYIAVGYQLATMPDHPPAPAPILEKIELRPSAEPSLEGFN
jgi:hypothetical protein